MLLLVLRPLLFKSMITFILILVTLKFTICFFISYIKYYLCCLWTSLRPVRRLILLLWLILLKINIGLSRLIKQWLVQIKSMGQIFTVLLYFINHLFELRVLIVMPLLILQNRIIILFILISSVDTKNHILERRIGFNLWWFLGGVEINLIWYTQFAWFNIILYWLISEAPKIINQINNWILLL